MPPKISLVPAPAQVLDIEGVSDILPPIKMRKSSQVPVPAPDSTLPSLPVPISIVKKNRKQKLSTPRQPSSDDDEADMSADARASSSDLIVLLEQKGYQLLAKVMAGDTLRALKVATIYGEVLLILLDKKVWQGIIFEPHDVVWRSATTSVGVPEAAKTGYSAAVDPTVAGVAIEQGPDLCVLLREGLESVPSEATYRLDSAVGKSIQAYPVLRISDILQAPDLATKSVHTNTLALQTYTRRLAEAGVTEALTRVQHITALLDGYHRIEGDVLKRMDASYRQLVGWYDAYQAMEQTPEIQKKQAQVAANIRVRQDAMRRLMRSSQAWSSDKTQAFLQDLETKLEEDMRYLRGVEKGINYVMTE